MNASERIIDFIKSFEQLRLNSYLCSAGKWTVGYGHTRTAKPGLVITERLADELLLSDLSIVEASINRHRLVLNQNQFDSLVSLVFNIGGPNFDTSTLLKRIKAGASANLITEAFMMWKFGGNGEHNGVDDDGDGIIDEPGEKQFLQGLLRRRIEEAKIYNS